MSIVGYKRVSTFDQNTARQLVGIECNTIYEDKISGGSTNRPQLDEMRRYVRKGDTIVVHSIDRLARNLQDLLSLIDEFTKQGVELKFIKEQLNFTGEDNPFQKLQMQIIGAVSEFERNMIRSRQQEGIERAKAKGVYKGGKKTLDRDSILKLKAEGIGSSQIAKQLNVARSSVYRVLEEEKIVTRSV